MESPPAKFDGNDQRADLRGNTGNGIRAHEMCSIGMKNRVQWIGLIANPALEIDENLYLNHVKLIHTTARFGFQLSFIATRKKNRIPQHLKKAIETMYYATNYANEKQKLLLTKQALTDFQTFRAMTCILTSRWIFWIRRRPHAGRLVINQQKNEKKKTK